MVEVDLERRQAADSIRDAYDEFLSEDDDARMTTVTFVESTPEHVLDDARRTADDVRGEIETSAGQAPLSDKEREQIDFTSPRANVLHARSVKGIALDEGVDDWIAFYDPTLTVDEHREVMKRAAREEQGQRLDAEDSAEERAGRAARVAQSEECDHARGHCEHGDVEACEFLKTQCGFSDDEVSRMLSDEVDPDDDGEPEQQQLVTVGEGTVGEMDVPPEEAGALNRSWQGYKAAISNLESQLQPIREAVVNARQALRAINGIRESHGQDPLHPDRLHELLKVLEEMPGSIPETRTLEHFGSDDSEGDVQEESADVEDDTDDEQVIEQDDQRTFGGGRADPQARLAGGEEGERGQGEVEQTVEENPGGIMADTRDDEEILDEEDTEQMVPDAFAVSEGGQRTL